MNAAHRPLRRVRFAAGVDRLDLPSVEARLRLLSALVRSARGDVRPNGWKNGFDWAYAGPDDATFNLQQDPDRLHVAVHRSPFLSAFSFECHIAAGSGLRLDGLRCLRLLMRTWRAALRTPVDDRWTVAPATPEEEGIALRTAALIASFGGASQRTNKIRIIPPSPWGPGRIVGVTGGRDVLKPAAAAAILAEEPTTATIAIGPDREYGLSPDEKGHVVALPILSAIEAMRVVRSLPPTIAVPESLPPRLRR